MSAEKLFWSRLGQVACRTHAPAPDSEQWKTEGWQEIPPPIEGRPRPRYQCQHCSKRAIAHPTCPSKPASPLVLNVDDQPAQLYARDRVLRLHGFTVANADSIKKAIETARQIKPNVMLLDVHLPDGDGRELCRRLQADPELSHIPIVLISATLAGHAQQLETVRWAGAAAFIKEPVAPEAIVSTIWKVLTAA